MNRGWVLIWTSKNIGDNQGAIALLKIPKDVNILT